ncbi:MAG TPA: ATP synthase F1 subunit delta, partial [Candidatus Limnocylindrales bacterium]|nr:ATP synthase F1 subunit delta [Candidatus Limnocylindrales bacterium]
RLLGPRVTRQVLNLARLLTEKNRIELAPAIAREYATLLNRARGIVEAVVTTARPLGPDEVAEVRRKVEELAGAAVDLRVVVDPSLIGGLTVRVGDRLLDASVRGRLERLRARLLAGAR